TEPLPVLARVVEQVGAPGLEVGADAERAARARHDHYADLVVPARVLAGARDLAKHAEIERVQHLGPVQRDRRPGRRLLVDDPLETELVGRDRRRRVRFGHGRETNSIARVSGGNALAVTFSLVAGVAGTVQIAVMGRLGDRIGVVAAFAFAAVVVDQYGLFGLDRIAIGWPRLVGLALLAAGTALVLRR